MGRKSKRESTDTLPYYDEMSKLFYLNDARKLAKKGLREAQETYGECCTALQKEKQRLDNIFSAICSDEELKKKKE